MKKAALFCVLGLCGVFMVHLAMGQIAKKSPIPEARYLKYEGVLTDPSGTPVNGILQMTFGIYESSLSPSPLWEESYEVSLNNGEFEVTLGRKRSIPELQEGTYYIGVTVGGEELLPRQPIALGSGGGDGPSDFPHQLGHFPDTPWDLRYVNEGQENSITSNMIVDGEVGTSDLAEDVAFGVVGNAAEINLNKSDGTSTIKLNADNNGWGLIELKNGTLSTAVIQNESDGGAAINLYNSTNQRTFKIDADMTDNSSHMYFWDDGSKNTIELDAEASGGGAEALLSNSEGTQTIKIDAEDAASAGELTLSNSNGGTTVDMFGSFFGRGGRIELRENVLEGTTPTIVIDAAGNEYAGGALIDMSNGSGENTIVLDADNNGWGLIELRNGTLSTAVIQNESDGGAAINLYNSTNNRTFKIDADMTDNSSKMIFWNDEGTDATIELDAEYGDLGHGRITTDELEITGGSDLSEQFKIRGDFTASPGMVMCIDPEHPGELVVSSKANDRTVAGIVSGAGGVQPGMLMGQAGSAADGKYPVALTGRVYCMADASYGPIQPGDLLTTSATAGHAMKVTDYAKAQGAIIGKAMTSLSEGSGLVLVLVSLQ
jgi:hypothetical protein